MKYLKTNNSEADKRSRKFYNSTEWKRLRNHFIQVNPLCVECDKIGLIEPAVDIDHITPLKDNYGKALEWENLQGLCKKHHTQKTVKENSGKKERIKEAPSTLDNLMNKLLNND